MLLGVTLFSASCDKTEGDLTSVHQLDTKVMEIQTVPATGIIFESLFERTQSGFNASQGGDWNGVEAANANSIVRSTEQAKAGSYSAKFTLNKSDEDQGGSKRAELTDWSGRMEDPKSERWYGLSMFLPSSFIADPCEEMVFQWHGVNSVDLDGESMSNPALAMITRNGRWVFNDWDGPVDLGLYTKDAWTDWVLHIKFSPDQDGLIEIWKNGAKVFTRTGKNTYRDKVGNYFKMGIYKYGWKDGYTTNTSTRILYFDEVRVGDETSSYAAVAPRTSTSSGTSVTPVPTPAPNPEPSPVENPEVIAINAGGSAASVGDGTAFQADKYFQSGKVSSTTSGIQKTSDDVLYRSSRYDKRFAYSVPVKAGTYLVTFKFAETSSRPSGNQFDVVAEGKKVISNLDVYRMTGKNSAYDLTKTVSVSDGKLDLQFNADRGNARVSAIKIVQQ